MLQDSHLVNSWTILLVICVGASPPRHPPRTRGHPELAPELARPRQAGEILQLCRHQLKWLSLPPKIQLASLPRHPRPPGYIGCLSSIDSIDTRVFLQSDS